MPGWQDKIKCEVLYVLSTKSQKDGGKIDLRIVLYNDKWVKVENKSFFKGDDGEIRPGKNKGLSLKDIDTIVEHYTTIKDQFARFRDATAPQRSFTDKEEIPF